MSRELVILERVPLLIFCEEFDNVFVPEYWFEIDFIRVPGGLLDLRHSLFEDWSPLRALAAYHEFIDIVNKMGCDPRPWDLIGLIQSTSQRYDRRFKGKFRTLSIDFLDQFKISSYKADCYFDAFVKMVLIFIEENSSAPGI
ncbi:MAG: hypothetical protein HQL78_07065 [Magnetococcales bacterium]|nr:hypothetical protein [Magnetococcales bacterium]